MFQTWHVGVLEVTTASQQWTGPGSLCSLSAPAGRTAHSSTALWFFWVQDANQNQDLHGNYSHYLWCFHRVSARWERERESFNSILVICFSDFAVSISSYAQHLSSQHPHAAMVKNSQGGLPPNLFGIFIFDLCPCLGHMERSVGYCLLFSHTHKKSGNSTHCSVNDFFYLQPGN